MLVAPDALVFAAALRLTAASLGELTARSPGTDDGIILGSGVVFVVPASCVPVQASTDAAAKDASVSVIF